MSLAVSGSTLLVLRQFCTLNDWRHGVVVSGVCQWTKLTHVGPGYNWDGYTISGCNQPTRSTQPCIPPGSLNRVPASAGVKGGNVTSAGWQVTLCDPIWHVSSRTGEASCELLYSVYTYLNRLSSFRPASPTSLRLWRAANLTTAPSGQRSCYVTAHHPISV